MTRNKWRTICREVIGHGLILMSGALIYFSFNHRPDTSQRITFEVRRAALIPKDEKLNPKKQRVPQTDTTKDTAEERIPIERPTEKYPIDSVGFDQLTAIGIPRRLAQTWVNYTEAGGQIRRAADVDKLYGMTPEVSKRLKERIQFDEPKPQKTKQPINVNTASAEELKALRGIGSVLSQRMVKFRDRLGGFTDLEQIGETYGIDDSLLNSIKPWIRIEPPLPSIDLNRISMDSLARHPYVSWKEAKVITRYRKEHGPFKKVEDVLDSRIVDSSWLSRMRPYLHLGRAIKKE